ncbi:MAG TPA: DUF3303 family protein [Terracidiphilus sp.]|nr:DUF3303 family protein [Terracidiphilus sp.]
MKFLSTFAIRPGSVPDAARRFVAGKAAPPPGITLLGRWHKADLSGGFTLYETNDAAAVYAYAAEWAPYLEMHTAPVVEDADAGPILARLYGQ